MAEDSSGFLDPVIRCDSCQALVTRTTIRKHGACTKCGNRRLRNVTVFDEIEKKQMEDWGFGEFVSEFGVVNEEAEKEQMDGVEAEKKQMIDVDEESDHMEDCFGEYADEVDDE